LISELSSTAILTAENITIINPEINKDIPVNAAIEKVKAANKVNTEPVTDSV
jgi:hypothetical protein